MGIEKMKNIFANPNLNTNKKVSKRVTDYKHPTPIISLPSSGTTNSSSPTMRPSLYLEHLENPNSESVKNLVFGDYSEDIWDAIMGDEEGVFFTEREHFLYKFLDISDSEVQKKALDFCNNYDTLKNSSEAQRAFGLEDYEMLNEIYNNPDLNYDNFESIEIPDNPRNNIIKLVSTLSDSSSDWKFLNKFLDIEDKNIQGLAVVFYNERDFLEKSSAARKKFGEAEYNVFNEIYKNLDLEYKGLSRDTSNKIDMYTIHDFKFNLDINIQKDYDDSKTFYNLTKALEEFNNLKNSNYYSFNLKKITFTSVESSDDAYWQKKYDDPSFVAAASAGSDGQITIYRHSNNNISSTLTHEMGHIVDLGHVYSDSDEYKDAVKKGFDGGVTPYASNAIQKTNCYCEDFAESYEILRRCGAEYFRVYYNSRYNYFKANFPELFDE